MSILDKQLGLKKDELRLLQESLVQAKADLQEALRLGETEVAEKCSHIRVGPPRKPPGSSDLLWITLEVFSSILPKCKHSFLTSFLHCQFGACVPAVSVILSSLCLVASPVLCPLSCALQGILPEFPLSVTGQMPLPSPSPACCHLLEAVPNSLLLFVVWWCVACSQGRPGV